MKLYAETPVRWIRQIIADVLLIGWAWLWIRAGMLVHDRALVAQEGARKLESGSGDLASNMTDAAAAMARVPLVGDAARVPFDKAASTGRGLAASGHDLATGVGRLAIALGILTALVPILFALIPWSWTRLRYAVRAGRLAKLRAMPGGRRLLALEALTSARPRQLARIGEDPAQLWQDGDDGATSALADLVLRTHGLTVRRGKALSAEGV